MKIPANSFGIAAFCILLPAVYGQVASPSVYAWSTTGPLAFARHNACVAALDDDRGLVAGGEGSSGLLNSVELYQSDGSFVPGQPLLHARSNHTCTVLNDGRVLVAGGKSDSGAAPAEIYDPDTDTWSDLDTPGLPRWNHTATLLPDSSVLLAGGETASGVSSDLEIFNPLTNRIEKLAASLSTGRTSHSVALLSDGRVLITGGTDGNQLLSSIDTYNPDGTVTAGLSLPEARAGHSATTLDDGRVLIAGGQGPSGDLNTALVFSPVDNTFQPAGPLTIARSNHLAFVLPGNGSVLIAGGTSANVPTGSTELFDPATATFSPAGALTLARRDIAAAPLNQAGVVLAVGGINSAGPLAACGSFLAPTITLDKSIYAQGDNPSVSGVNWPAGVTLRISSVVKTFSGVQTTASFDVKTTSSGSFQVLNALPAPLGVDSSGGSIRFSTSVTATVAGVTKTFSASATAPQIDPTTTTLTSSANKVLTLEKVTLKANVHMAAPALALQGFVTFFDGRTVLGTASTSAAPAGSPGAPSPGSTFTFDISGNNVFTLPNVVLSAGTRNLRAIFTPTSVLLGQSSGDASVLVEKRATVLTFTVSAPKNVKVGDTLTLSATVAPASGSSPVSILPSGAAQVFRNPVPGFLAVNLVPNSSTGASAGTATTPAGPAGSLTLIAGYMGDDNYDVSATSTNTLTIAQGVVAFLVTPNPVTATAGALINLTVQIQHPPAPASPATGTISVLNGPSNFSGNTVTVSPDPNDGSIISTPLQTFLQDAGSRTIQVHYSGNANYLPADLQVPATVKKIVPNLVISNFNPVCCQIPFTFQVDVTPPGNLLDPKAPTGLFDTLSPGIGDLDLLGDCVLSASTTEHGATCKPVAALVSGNFLTCTTTEEFDFTYHGDSNYESKTVTITKVVPINNPTCIGQAKAIP